MKFNKAATDYSLYLVTDSTMLPPDTTLVSQVHGALIGGATVVQLREKDCSTRQFIQTAQQLHTLTRQFHVPLIINDRVDVALAVGAEGVHVGQDDMPLSEVRAMVGDEMIVGVSTRDLDELEEVIKQGKADYVGIGAVFGTATKKLDKQPMGISGVKAMLSRLEKEPALKSVVIGGVNDTNALQVVSESATDSGFQTDGVAVVSCIMASPTAEQATKKLHAILNNVYGHMSHLKKIQQSPPLVHHITNNVVKNFSANVTLAIGASPIMSEAPQEFADLSDIPTACLVVNTGTVSGGMQEVYQAAIDRYMAKGRPIVFDPVGCGASAYRRQVNAELLKSLRGSNVVIKGNASEITALAGGEAKQRGVDSTDGALNGNELATAARTLSSQQNCTVIVTGAKDMVFNCALNKATVIESGHPMMGRITGSGCSLGSVVASFVAVSCASHHDTFNSCVKALCVYGSAGAAAAGKCQGPGSFMTAFLDELYAASQGKMIDQYTTHWP